MRVAYLALLGLLLVGCERQEPVSPLEEAKLKRASEIESLLSGIAESQGMVVAQGCYPPRLIGATELSVLANMAITAAEMETNGWEIQCASFAEPGDSYGAVDPQSGVLFECPIAEGLVIVMRRGSINDGSAECAIVQ